MSNAGAMGQVREQEIGKQEGMAGSSLKGILLIIASTLFFAVSDVTAKVLAESLPATGVAWLRYATFVLIVGLFLARNGGLATLRSRHYGLQILRGLGIVGSAFLFTSSLPFLPVADATAIYFISPILIMALSIVFLGETVGWRRWSAAVVGLIGVLIVIRPGTGAFQPAALLTLAGAMSWAAAAIVTRKMGGSDPALTTLTYSALVGFTVLSLALPFSWQTPDARQVLLGVCIGVMSTIGQWLVVLAYRQAKASLIAPYSYTQLISSGLLGYLVFNTLPDQWTITGACIIAASGLYTAYRERVRARG